MYKRQEPVGDLDEARVGGVGAGVHDALGDDGGVPDGGVAWGDAEIVFGAANEAVEIGEFLEEARVVLEAEEFEGDEGVELAGEDGAHAVGLGAEEMCIRDRAYR